MRAHPEPIGHYTPLPRPHLAQPAQPPTVLFVVPDAHRALYSGSQSQRHFAHNAADALKTVARMRPRLVVLDWDDESLGGREVCAASHAVAGTSVLVMTADVERVPAILRVGCNGILLKPFAPSILAGRIGRVLKETGRSGAQRQAPAANGTNRVWQDVSCPQCGTSGAISFDFSSYRRTWYACLSCDTTWLGPRRE